MEQAVFFLSGDTVSLWRTDHREKLRRVEMAEQFLFEMGFTQFRVRSHDRMARIEIRLQEFPLLVEKRKIVAARFKELGFMYITMDLEGFRSGSMDIGQV